MRFSYNNPEQPVCNCGRGYGSKLDGLCTQCRGKTAWEAQNPPPPKPGVIGGRCKHCDARGVYWQEIRTVPGNRKAWRLMDSTTGKLHECIVESKEMWD